MASDKPMDGQNEPDVLAGLEPLDDAGQDPLDKELNELMHMDEAD